MQGLYKGLTDFGVQHPFITRTAVWVIRKHYGPYLGHSFFELESVYDECWMVATSAYEKKTEGEYSRHIRKQVPKP